MAASFSLAPEPVWVLINLVGTVAGGGYITTKRSLNKDEDKPTYVDAGGEQEWPNPIFFDLNGTHAPIYFKFDPDLPDETYFIQAFDAQGANLWEVDNFTGSGAGGGGTVNEYFNLINLIANNVFIDHTEPVSVAANITNRIIAPSNHKGFTPSDLNPVTTVYGTVGPDIRFNKNDTGLSTDKITYPVFALSDSPMASEGDVTPVCCIEYVCTGTPAGETYKNFQFPICQKVKNLSNQLATFRIWAKVAATPQDIKVFTLQYYGSGTGATSPQREEQDTISLTTTWTSYVIPFTIPDVSANSLGTSGQQTDDDALYIQLEMPHGLPIDVLFTKPALYLGTFNPDVDFETYDQINSIDSTPRTGDIKTSLTSSAPGGWVAMNDGSIGNVGSGATRANADTFQLYKTIWDGVLDAWAPVSTGRGATAIADFIAGKTLTLPRSLGRAMAGAGTGSGLTARALGEYTGAESASVTLLPAHLPPHTHAYQHIFDSGVGGFGLAAGTLGTFPTFQTGNGPGTSTPISVPTVPPSSFMNVFIKL